MENVNTAGGRSADYELAARKLSVLIAGLNIDMATSKYLVQLIRTQVETAERDAFLYGFNYAEGAEGAENG